MSNIIIELVAVQYTIYMSNIVLSQSVCLSVQLSFQQLVPQCLSLCSSSYTMDVGGSHGGFVQWKPIVYTEEDKTVEDSELAYVEPVYDGKYTVIPWEKALPYSIVHPWYKGSSGLPIKNTSVFYVVYHPASGSTENPTFFSW